MHVSGVDPDPSVLNFLMSIFWIQVYRILDPVMVRGVRFRIRVWCKGAVVSSECSYMLAGEVGTGFGVVAELWE